MPELGLGGLGMSVDLTFDIEELKGEGLTLEGEMGQGRAYGEGQVSNVKLGSGRLRGWRRDEARG